MNKELFIYNNNKIINKDQLQSITDRLAENMNNKYFFNPEPYKVHKDINVFENYEGRNLRQSYYQNCTFYKANISKSGLAGSIFIQCNFKPCDYTDTNFQSCDFRECKFENIMLEYTRMNKSSFYKTTFINCIFKSVSINDAFFDDCKFINCRWTISIENTIFKNTLLDSVKFKSMNFEFATFENIKTNNIKLPFPTIPFIYNGLKYISSTEDNVRVTSAKRADGLCKEEYLSYIEDLEKFYSATQNCFPIVNICIAKGEYEKAFETLYHGIKIAIQTRAFRMIKYYCKQIKYIDNITMHQKQDLYFFILNEISKCNLEEFERNSLNVYLPEVKDLLFLDSYKDKLEVLFDTDINENEFDKLSILLLAIDDLLKDKCTYSLELRHNSPFQVFIKALSDPVNIQIIISSLELIATVTIGAISIKKGKKEKLDKNEKNKCKDFNNTLKENNINVFNVYLINNGNIYTNNQFSSSGDIYLNK